MVRFLLATLVIAMLGMTPVHAAEKDGRLYEMRIYWAAPGKLEALHSRFRDHTTKLFAKHGMKNVGYFVPVGDNPDRKIVYFLSYPDRQRGMHRGRRLATIPTGRRPMPPPRRTASSSTR